MSRSGIGELRSRRLSELYRAYAPAAYNLAFLLTGDRELANDLAQEAFVRVVARFEHLRKRDSFDFYLRRTVVNLTRSHFRKKSVEARYLQRQSTRTASFQLPDFETRDQIWSQLQQIPLRQRVALVLRFYEDLSEQQTSRLMGISERAVNALVSRGLDELRRITGEQYE